MCCVPENTGCYLRPHVHPGMGVRMAFRPHFFHRRYFSREETTDELKEYLKELEQELKGVRERISELEKEK